jgi:hypothetical protein
MLAVVHDLTDYRITIGHYLYQIQCRSLRCLEGFIQWNHAHLLAILIDQPDLSGLDLVVNTGLLGAAFSGISFDSCSLLLIDKNKPDAST